jgi:hypothetical protein
MSKYLDKKIPVKLDALITSGDLHNKTDILICDEHNRLLQRGRWHDNVILDYADRLGVAFSAQGFDVGFRLLADGFMTNRHRLRKELMQLDDKDLYNVLSAELREKILDPAMCAWCKAKHGGECPEADKEDRTCGGLEEWWSAWWDGEKILDTRAEE